MPALLVGMVSGRIGLGQYCKAIIGAEVYAALSDKKRRQHGELVRQAASKLLALRATQ